MFPLSHVYLAGPMRGYPRYNFDAFEAAEKDLTSQGIAVISPHRMDLLEGFDPEGSLDNFSLEGAVRRDTDAIIRTQGVVFLPDWEKSKGATSEKVIADWLGRPCFTYPDLQPLGGAENEDILHEAYRITSADRNVMYGEPKDNMHRTALIFEAILGHKVTTQEVALCMIGVKLSREAHRPKRDNRVDIAGWARVLDRLYAEV